MDSNPVRLGKAVQWQFKLRYKDESPSEVWTKWKQKKKKIANNLKSINGFDKEDDRNWTGDSDLHFDVKILLALRPIKSVIRPRANKKCYWPGSLVMFRFHVKIIALHDAKNKSSKRTWYKRKY